MKKNLLFTPLLLLFAVSAFSQTDRFWSANNQPRGGIIADKAVLRLSYPENIKLFNLNFAPFRQELMSIVDRRSATSTVISLPNAAGGTEEFEVYEASNFEPALQAQFPAIRSYSGKGITDKSASLKLSISPQGIQAMMFRTDKENEFIEPYSKDHTVYSVYSSARNKGTIPWRCSTPEGKLITGLNGTVGNVALRSGGDLKTMRLAQSVTAEYSNYFGATSSAQVNLVLAAINNTLTRCNGVYEKDLALHLDLIANTTAVIYYNPSSDPYSDAPAGSAGAWNAQLQNTLTSVIGAANYDIGHLFGASGGGGNAGCTGCVCVDNSKGSGFTSPSDGVPQGDNFDIDYVVHEVGHQLGANHTFSMSNEGTGVNKEPGSGITIMGYAGITSQDLASHSFDFYHQASIAQIQANLATKTCPATTSISGGNATPVIDALTNDTIPRSTPFALTGSATDANAGDALTYCWEQNDNASSAQTGVNSVASPTKASGPNWISFRPTTSPTRYFPQLSTILAGDSVTGPLAGGDAGANTEALSSVARTLNFRLTVRDNAVYRPTAPASVASVGQTQFADMVVTVDGTAGPFAVTAPNTAVSWTGGSSQTITWSVNNTNVAPVNCANVKISLSTDGGLTFPTVLAESTPNDGNEVLKIPNFDTKTARIKIEAVGNIFFDISDKNFAIALGSPSLWLRADADIIRWRQPGVIIPNVYPHSLWLSDNDDVNGWYSEEWNTGAGVGGGQYNNVFDCPTWQSNVIGGKPAIFFDRNYPYQGLHGLTSTGTKPGEAKTVLVVGQIACNAASIYPQYDFPVSGRLVTFESYFYQLSDGSYGGSYDTYGLGILQRTGQTNVAESKTQKYHDPPSPLISTSSSIPNNYFNIAQKPFLATYLVTPSNGQLSFRLNKQNVATSGGASTNGDTLQLPIRIGDGWQGWISEVIVFDALLNAHDLDSVENYLVQKYSLPLTAEPPAAATLSASSTTICAGEKVTLNIAVGALNSATQWAWYRDECGGIFQMGYGTSIDVSPDVTSTYFARGEGGGCVKGPCGNGITITVQNPDSTSGTAPSISASSDSVCTGETITLNITAGTLRGGAVWKWYYDACGFNSFRSNLLGEGSSLTVTPNPINGSWGSANAYFARAEGPGCSVGPCTVKIIDSKPSHYYVLDADGDRYSTGPTVDFCNNPPPPGYVDYWSVIDYRDCNDNDPGLHRTFAFYVDADGDGYGTGALVQACAINATTPPSGYSTNNTDCNDDDPGLHRTFAFYIDADDDGFGAGILVEACAVDASTPPVGYSTNNLDCNDYNPGIYPTGVTIIGSSLTVDNLGKNTITLSASNPGAANFLFGLSRGTTSQDTILQASNIFTNVAPGFWEPFIRDVCGDRNFPGFGIVINPSTNTNMWTGAASDVWEDVANWSSGVLPDANTNVIINGGRPNNPQLNSNVTIRSITMDAGASLTVKIGFRLTILN